MERIGTFRVVKFSLREILSQFLGCNFFFGTLEKIIGTRVGEDKLPGPFLNIFEFNLTKMGSLASQTRGKLSDTSVRH